MKLKFIIPILIIIAASAASIKIIHYYRQRELNRQAAATKKVDDVKITLIEGWTIDDISQYLEKQGIMKARDFTSEATHFSSDNFPILASKPQSASLEGFLFPDTYRIIKPGAGATSTSQEIIKKTLANLENKFTGQMRQDAAQKGMTPYQILTLASIIERETGRNAVTQEQKDSLLEERKIIAGIFYNRLNANMPLASDATVNYITKKNNPQASITDTKIDSPYNTYKYAGLPPGPISNPSLSSIMAAVYPTKTDYYFFLHTQPDGKAIYSKTFEEHLKNKQKYLP